MDSASTPARADVDPLRLGPQVAQDLVCPRDAHAPLARSKGQLICTHPGCGLRFPIVDGIPVLIDESRSIFELNDFVTDKPTTLDLRDEAQRLPTLKARLKARVVSIIPSLSLGTSDFTAAAALMEVERSCPNPRVLVIGAGDVQFASQPGTTLIYSDVARGPLIHVIADAHDLPFADASFDAVLAIAVLQYLPDPARAMMQTHRILKPGGLAYVVAPMIQQNTLGPHDYFLYTHAGLRRVMRCFTEVRSGVANGPAMALSWTIEAFMTSMSETRWVRSLLSNLTRLVIWPLKYLDRGLSRKRGAYDCASALYFFGRRAEFPVSDRDISRGYRGLKWGA